MNVLAAEFQTLAPVGDFAAGAVAEAVAEPGVLGLGIVDPLLVSQDVGDGADAAEGETAVAAVAGGRVPGRADPVVGEPGVEVRVAVGAEDAWFRSPSGWFFLVFFTIKGGVKVGGDNYCRSGIRATIRPAPIRPRTTTTWSKTD